MIGNTQAITDSFKKREISGYVIDRGLKIISKNVIFGGFFCRRVVETFVSESIKKLIVLRLLRAVSVVVKLA